MKMRSGLLTLFAVMVMAVSAHAGSIGTYDITTGFDNWSDISSEGHLLGMDISGFGILPNSFIRTYGEGTSTIDFDYPADQLGTDHFEFNYFGWNGQDITNVISGGLYITLGSATGTLAHEANWYVHTDNPALTVTSISATEVFIAFSGMGSLEFLINASEELVVMTSIALLSKTPMIIDDLGYNPVATPIPGAALLLGTGLVGLVGFRRRFKA